MMGENKLKIAVCDDEQEVVTYVIGLLREFEKETGEDFYIQGYTNPLDFMNACKTTEFDFVYLDMEMNEYNGVAVAMEMRKTLPNAHLTYITAHIKYVQKSFYVESFQYLLKPINPVEFKNELGRSYIKYKTRVRCFEFKTSNGLITMKTSNIIYIETSYKECKIHCTLGSHFGTSEALRKIKDQLEELGFCKIQRSFLINLEHVLECGPDSVVMDNGHVLTLSRKYAKELKQRFMYLNQ